MQVDGSHTTMKDIQKHNDGTFSKEEIIKELDRCLFMNEFAVAYDEPIEDPYYEAQGRGYLMAFVRYGGPDSEYERVQYMSGDDAMIRRYFSEMASEGPFRIMKFIE